MQGDSEMSENRTTPPVSLGNFIWYSLLSLTGVFFLIIGVKNSFEDSVSPSGYDAIDRWARVGAVVELLIGIVLLTLVYCGAGSPSAGSTPPEIKAMERGRSESDGASEPNDTAPIVAAIGIFLFFAGLFIYAIVQELRRLLV